MSFPAFIKTALCLAASDVAALVQGRTIAAISQTFIRIGQGFALYPYDAVSIPLLVQSQQLALTSTESSQQLDVETVTVDVWARCELCQIVNSSYPLEDLVKLTHFTLNELQAILQKKQHLFLVFLRVYLFSNPIDIGASLIQSDKVGRFVSLSSTQATSASCPVLSDRTFAQRKHKLENLEPPDHPELEALHDTIAQLAIVNPKANHLKQYIAEFLGWSEPKYQNTSGQTWISTINELATRSKESDDDRKSNYQAGTDFENVVRQGLAYLGFKVEEAYKGGAGGLDLFCSEPYPLVGECKSGRSITDRAVEELDRIGRRHLRDDYTKATRIIIGPGLPTKNLQESALISKTSILSAMTFQKLVELQAKYPGSINLIELKNHLQPGQSDESIEHYINLVFQSLQVRSHIIQIVKDCLDKLKLESTEIAALHTAYAWSNSSCSLKQEDLYAILLELSSPLTGYLGRIKGSDWKSDRFYFLRLLNLES